MYVTLPPFNPRYPDATIELKSEWVSEKKTRRAFDDGGFFLLTSRRASKDGWMDGWMDTRMGWDGMG